jgi:hypothetical protein
VDGREYQLEMKSGAVRLKADQVGKSIHAKLLSEGWQDGTEYPKNHNYIPQPTKDRYITKASFMHPDASKIEPINCGVGIYLDDGSEYCVQVVDNAFKTEDENVANVLLRLNWPVVNIEYGERPKSE